MNSETTPMFSSYFGVNMSPNLELKCHGKGKFEKLVKQLLPQRIWVTMITDPE